MKKGTILLSPWSKKLRDGNENPKNYRHWEQVVSALVDYEVVQVGVVGEEIVKGVTQTVFNLSLKDLKTLLDQSITFASVDNFFPHFAAYHRKRGVVLFGQSDPVIFGYEQNVNLLKGREYLRKKQFDIWEFTEFNQTRYNADAFVEPNVVSDAILSLCSK